MFLTSCDFNVEPIQSEEGTVKVSFIDVGQGDCILIQTDECNFLIDAGESGNSEYIEQYLNSNNIEDFDYIIGTHPHSDHIGGLSQIISDYNVERIILPKIPDNDIPTTKTYENLLNAISDKNLKITPATVGNIYDLGNATLEVVAPNSKEYSDFNNYSIVTILTHGDNKFLFSGDAEEKSESEMIENNLLQDIDVLKVGHHGSNTSTSQEFLDIIQPEISVIMCGEGNKYNHPNEETMDKFQAMGVDVYRTDLDGTIEMVSDGMNIDITFSEQLN